MNSDIGNNGDVGGNIDEVGIGGNDEVGSGEELAMMRSLVGDADSWECVAVVSGLINGSEY